MICDLLEKAIERSREYVEEVKRRESDPNDTLRMAAKSKKEKERVNTYYKNLVTLSKTGFEDLQAFRSNLEEVNDLELKENISGQVGSYVLEGYEAEEKSAEDRLKAWQNIARRLKQEIESETKKVIEITYQKLKVPLELSEKERKVLEDLYNLDKEIYEAVKKQYEAHRQLLQMITNLQAKKSEWLLRESTNAVISALNDVELGELERIEKKYSVLHVAVETAPEILTEVVDNYFKIENLPLINIGIKSVTFIVFDLFLKKLLAKKEWQAKVGCIGGIFTSVPHYLIPGCAIYSGSLSILRYRWEQAPSFPQ